MSERVTQHKKTTVFLISCYIMYCFPAEFMGFLLHFTLHCLVSHKLRTIHHEIRYNWVVAKVGSP